MTIHFTYKGYDFKVTHYHYTKGSPGKLSGPPENCYPPEPAEIEDIELEIYNQYGNKEYEKLPDSMVDFLMEDDMFYEELLEAVEDSIFAERDYSEDDWREDR